MIKLGVIGMGGIAYWMHVPQANATGKFYIKAAMDVTPDSILAKQRDIPDYYTDYRKMLEDPEIDAVIITSPHHVHEEHCVAAFEAGKHVLLEKPISRNLEEARNIMAAAEKSGKIGMIGFCQRFDGRYSHIKSMLDKGELGELLSARIDHYQNFNPAQGSWWRSEEKVGGGAVIGSGVHRLDILRWYFGEPISVYAKAVKMSERLEAEACAHAVIEFDSGVIANFSINWAVYGHHYYEGFSVAGKKGSIIVENGVMMSSFDMQSGEVKPVEIPPCQSMYEHFADCILNNKQPLTTLEEGYKTQRLVRAIYKSIETGRIIDPSTVEY